jgi:hypothetical protein
MICSWFSMNILYFTGNFAGEKMPSAASDDSVIFLFSDGDVIRQFWQNVNRDMLVFFFLLM